MGSHLADFSIQQKDFEALRAMYIDPAETEQRLALVESAIDQADKYRLESEALQERMGFLEQKVSNMHDQMSESSITVETRLAWLEKTSGDAIDKHAFEIAAVKAAHDAQRTTLARDKVAQVSLQERIDVLEKGVHQFCEKRSAAMVINKTDGDGGEFAKLQELSPSHSSSVDILKEYQAEVKDQLIAFENQLRDSS